MSGEAGELLHGLLTGDLAELWLAVGIAACFAGLVLSGWAAAALITHRQGISRSLAALPAIAEPRAEPAPGPRLRLSRADRLLAPLRRRLTAAGRRVINDRGAARLRERLDRAGNPTGWDADRLIALTVLAAGTAGLVGLALGSALGAPPGWTALLAAVFAVGGWVAPALWLERVAANRFDQIRRVLPEALDLLTISVEAGLPFNAALSQVARKTPGPLAGELARALQEMQIGIGRVEALRAMAARVEVPELRSFVQAIVQADAYGVPVADVLRVQAQELRVKRSQRAEEAAQKVGVKMLFPLVLCILPALFVVVLGPAVINVLRSLGR